MNTAIFDSFVRHERNGLSMLFYLTGNGGQRAAELLGNRAQRGSMIQSMLNRFSFGKRQMHKRNPPEKIVRRNCITLRDRVNATPCPSGQGFGGAESRSKLGKSARQNATVAFARLNATGFDSWGLHLTWQFTKFVK